MYTVHYTVYNAQCTLYNVHCTYPWYVIILSSFFGLDINSNDGKCYKNIRVHPMGFNGYGTHIDRYNPSLAL